ncbi:VOC family protein [Nocardioides sp. GY 10113]|uniref:VOC family protein n=1 Tax=Nocardioides sp. GY 10113 TaxID=2569761 RepID=UPI0010A8DC3F|nr:VOC family protein [Nocardioides sp. GY 10113]TIC79669.1 VOC family protein [Nocardioides sp. GY 10113]TIC85794.1 VOC family protein [Nocardioides sp. GY 10113]
MTVTVAELVVADPPEAWVAAGFAVDEGPGGPVCRVGSVRIRLAGPDAGRGIVGWALRGLPPGVPAEVDGVPTALCDEPPAAGAEHPNGVTHVDHVVLLSPHLDRTVAALAGLGLEPRRERDGDLGGRPVRQVFYRLGEVILEVVGSPGESSDEPARLWGLTHVVEDLDAVVALLGEAAGTPKDAVQPGRRITTLRTRDLGMSVRTALITPHVPGAGQSAG